MDVNALIASLQESVPGVRCEPGASNDLQPTLYVSRDELPAVARTLRQDPGLRFNFLAELTADGINELGDQTIAQFPH